MSTPAAPSPRASAPRQHGAGRRGVPLLKRRLQPLLHRQRGDAAAQQLRPELQRVIHDAAAAPHAAAAEHGGEVGRRGGERLGAEEHPAEYDQHHRAGVAHERRQTLQSLAPEELFPHEQHKEPKSPGDEIPARAVPHSGQEPDDEEVPHIARPRAAVTAERDIHIVAEPGGK